MEEYNIKGTYEPGSLEEVVGESILEQRIKDAGNVTIKLNEKVKANLASFLGGLTSGIVVASLSTLIDYKIPLDLPPYVFHPAMLGVLFPPLLYIADKKDSQLIMPRTTSAVIGQMLGLYVVTALLK